MSALHQIALIVLAAACSEGLAIGLGSIQVQSSLNQPLRVSLPIFGTDITNIGELCPKGKIESVDGVLLARPQINFGNGAQPSALVITTTQAINEPAVAINIEIGCGTSVRRSYQALLDPVAILPATTNAQAVRQQPPLADVSMNPVPQASAASSAASVTALPTAAVPAKKSRDEKAKEAKASNAKRNRRIDAEHAEQRIAEQPKAVEKKPVSIPQARSQKVSRNVLRLSADVSPADSTSMLNGLKLSDSITVEGLQSDPQKNAELRTAQLRFAAIMRGEDPEKNAENETKAAQEKIQVLLKEADQIKQQSEQDRLTFEAEQKKSLHINWFVGLGALVLVCLMAIAWLARSLYQVNKMNQRPFWDHYDSEDDNAEEHDEHEDSPFSDTVVEFEDTSSLVDDDVPIASAEKEHSENDASFGKAARRINDVSKGLSVKTPSVEKAGERTAETSAEILTLQKPTVAVRNRKRSEMIEVEEISDAMEEAEFWMSLRDPQRAISVLEQFGDVERPKSPMAWLYLLKLYREVDDRSRFDALLQRFKSHFNTKAPEWDAKADEMSGKGLEDYPHLVNQICILWGNGQVARYLEDLLFNNRSGQREGFDLPVYLDLIMLANIAYEVFPTNRNGKPATVSHI
ncbi:MAG: FimV/HubP-related protein [Burkholderiaceae bacterium]